MCGGEEEDRTPDLRIANATLSQLSYPPNGFNSTQNVRGTPALPLAAELGLKLYKLQGETSIPSTCFNPCAGIDYGHHLIVTKTVD